MLKVQEKKFTRSVPFWGYMYGRFPLAFDAIALVKYQSAPGPPYPHMQPSKVLDAFNDAPGW